MNIRSESDDRSRNKKVKSLLDNKVSFHNYDDYVTSLPSRKFKEKYLTDFSRVSSNEIDGLTPQQEEVLLLKNILIQSLDKWLDAYKDLYNTTLEFFEISVTNSRAHRFKKIAILINNLLLIDTKTILDQPNQTEHYIQHMLNELKSFAKQLDSYSGFRKLFKQEQAKEDIEFVLSDMLDGIKRFYDLQGVNLQSELLKQFRSQLATDENETSEAAACLLFDRRTTALAQVQSWDLEGAAAASQIQ
ncbi:hypothetical protein Psal071_00340 [Piscirickettsia salmonis]|uniref:Uncharacterized protein n=1 Tax=Piscirickettsia salmonis TaxID=1238 RepID=A0A9Q6PRS4_PISSA|nr:hypothetical protein [Piscirickettsia salmonis]QGN93779.1 hypothetical protein Psal006a_00343 [Piscirickettsia salmonis]QGO04722.1 hypothetical protein Psal009_00594 [Piscirickettsia salmonis]QGO07658.1 hypothetical protein Psal009_03617 [Piscirickettsia salmonis]QGO33043.1 hypothetical protein Psal028_00341 [Piscirickettsia salmonis]QGO36655.1 hypothetical protein Psal040_00341 [Piscirickettsia salmonis]